MTKYRLGHKGASYLSTLLDTKLIYTQQSANINLCLWSVPGLCAQRTHQCSVGQQLYKKLLFLFHLSGNFDNLLELMKRIKTADRPVVVTKILDS